jgi:hypothetical protein
MKKAENGLNEYSTLLRHAVGRCNMKKWLIAGVGAAGLLISSAALARVDVGISIGVPGVIYPAPVYVAPQPVYVPPPPPVYYRPAPVYVAPPVVYPAPVYYRGGGGRYYDRGYYHGRGHGHGHYRGRGHGDRD